MKTVNCLLAALAMAVSTAPAKAQQACMPRDAAIKQLEQRYKEAVTGRGLAANGVVMIEMFVAKSGSWTVLASNPRGLSCVVATGDSWETVAAVVGDPA